MSRWINHWIDFLMSRQGRTVCFSCFLVMGLAITVLWILQGSNYFRYSGWRFSPLLSGPLLALLAAYLLYRTRSGVNDEN
jgi:hypothetical protein